MFEMKCVNGFSFVIGSSDMDGVRLCNLKMVLSILFCMMFILAVCVSAAVDHSGLPYDMIGRKTDVKMSILFATDNLDFGAKSAYKARKHLFVLVIAFCVCCLNVSILSNVMPK